MGEKRLGGQVGQVISALEITDPNCCREVGGAGRSPPMPSPHTDAPPTQTSIPGAALPPPRLIP